MNPSCVLLVFLVLSSSILIDAKKGPETDRTQLTHTTKQRPISNGAKSEESEFVQKITAAVGGSIRLNCGTTDSIEWTHQEIGHSTPTDVYRDGRGLIGAYRKLGRHSVELETKNLLIAKVATDDAGIYRCTIKNTWNDIVVLNLAVTVSNLVCSMTPDWNDIVGENDCGIDPDIIRFTCSIAYHGDFAPTLQWLHSGQQDVIENGVETSMAHSYSTSMLSVPARLALNGTYYMCRVKEAHPSDTQLTWTSPPLYVQYFFNSQTIEASGDDEIPCSADSSQSCEYKWINDQQRYTSIIKDSVFKPREDVTREGIYHCRAECRIRDKTCVSIPIRTKNIMTGLPCNRGNVLYCEIKWGLVIFVSCSVVFVLSVLVLSVAGICVCYKRRCRRHHRQLSRMAYSVGYTISASSSGSSASSCTPTQLSMMTLEEGPVKDSYPIDDA